MAQFARPDADDSIGSWTDHNSLAVLIYLSIDETSASDSDYVRSENDPSSSAYVAGLSTVTDPTSSSNHVCRYRYQKQMSGGGQPGTIDLTIELRQGTTVIASQTHNDIPDATWTAGTFTLTSGEADNITDYSNLNVRMVADKSAGARTSWAEVSWFEFEVPDVSSGDTFIENLHHIGDGLKPVTASKLNGVLIS